jgi:hypothetical protein
MPLPFTTLFIHYAQYVYFRCCVTDAVEEMSSNKIIINFHVVPNLEHRAPFEVSVITHN